MDVDTCSVSSDEIDKQIEQELKLASTDITDSVEEMKKYLQQQKEQHEAMMKSTTEQISQLHDQLKSFRDSANSSKEKLKERASKMREMRQLASEIEKEAERLKKEKGALQQETDVLREITARDKEQLNKVPEALSRLQDTVDLYKDILGMELRSLSDGRMQIVFTEIDPREPEKIYQVTVKVVGRKYQVTSHEPAIADMAELTKRLNESLNLRSFVITVRERFCDTVVKS